MNIANILICIAGILWGVELIPQIIKTFKTKNVEGISIFYFLLCFLAYVLYVTGNLLLNNFVIIFAHIPSMIGLSIILIMLFKYKNKAEISWEIK